MFHLRPQTHFSRYQQIVEVLARHGGGYLVGVLELDRFVPIRRGAFGRRADAPTRPEHVRLALEELGTTFIKLGQILSTRPDLLPPEYQAELAKLQDAAPPVDPDLIRERIAAELGRPVEEAFASFDPAPLAAASIGQAHAASLLDGTEVVVKVRRPGVVEQVEEDLEILQNLAATASRRWEVAERYDLVGLAQEFAQTLRAELDYIREGRSAERFAESFAGDPGLHIPRVYWDTTTSRVLTLERMRGIKIDSLAELDAAGIDRPDLARRATGVLLKMVFEDGFFHADPHPGNFFVEPNGAIALIDFGMTGTLDERTKGYLVEVLLGVAGQDPDRLVDTFLELGVARRKVDRILLRRDLEHILARYYGQVLSELRIGAVLGDILAVIRRHYLQLPPNLALLIKTAIMAEGLGTRLDPNFQLSGVIEPYAHRFLLAQYSPREWGRRLSTAGLEAMRLGVNLPLQARRLIGELERGGLEVGMRPEGFEPIVRRFERLANRIVLGILAAAFVNGLAVLLSVYRPPGWDQWMGALIAVGFALAVALGVYLAWTILRSGRG